MVGFAALVVAAIAAHLVARRGEVIFTRQREDGPDAGRLVICCSGGGIRLASFCLGALQTLFTRGLYDKASSVIGVSGGGYMAAAFHVLRREGVHPFESGSPELAHLRRHTEYLLHGGRAKFRAALSLLYGLTINLLLIGIALRAISWVLGWSLVGLGVIGSNGGRITINLRPDGSRWLLLFSCSLLLLGTAVFVIEKVWDRLGVVPDGVRRVLSPFGGFAMAAGVPLAVLLLGVPGALELINRLPVATSGQQPTLPQALVSLVDPDRGGVASFGALALALVSLGRTIWIGMENTNQSQSALRHVLRNRLAPWLGSVIILAAAAIALLRWTGGYATDPSYVQDWSIAGVIALIAILIKLFTDANHTSLHPYYREKLSTAYLVQRSQNGAAVSLEYDKPLRYSTWALPAAGGPQLVVGAVANVSDTDFVPSQRGCVPFVFDPEQIGIVGDMSLPQDGRRSTASYESDADYLHREVTAPAAMAISGAAFSPLTGRVNARTRPLRLLLAVLNLRLGVWLPNPYWNSRKSFNPPASPSARLGRYVASLADKPGPYRLLREAFGSPSLYERRIYVTDGGHYDNLGLVGAVRRRPKHVIVIEATGSGEDRFSALGEAIATARMDHGIVIDLDPAPMVRGTAPRAGQAWTRGVATHPLSEGETEPYETEIFYLASVVAGELSWDIEEYAAANPDFPRRGTGDQLYGEFDFEAYRALGGAVAHSMVSDEDVMSRLDSLPEPPDADVTAMLLTAK